MSQVTNTAEDPWYVCGCGNKPDRDGYVDCDARGESQEEDIGSPSEEWDGAHLRCRRCGVVFRVAGGAL